MSSLAMRIDEFLSLSIVYFVLQPVHWLVQPSWDLGSPHLGHAKYSSNRVFLFGQSSTSLLPSCLARTSFLTATAACERYSSLSCCNFASTPVMGNLKTLMFMKLNQTELQFISTHMVPYIIKT